jgi:hypothetical protein
MATVYGRPTIAGFSSDGLVDNQHIPDSMWTPQVYLGFEPDQGGGPSIYATDMPNVEYLGGWGWDGSVWNTARRATVLGYIADLGGNYWLDHEFNDPSEWDAAVTTIEAEMDANVPAGIRGWWYSPFVPGEHDLGDYRTSNLSSYQSNVADIMARPLPKGLGLIMSCYIASAVTFDTWWKQVAERCRVWRRRRRALNCFISCHYDGEVAHGLQSTTEFTKQAKAILNAGFSLTFWEYGDTWANVSPYFDIIVGLANGN